MDGLMDGRTERGQMDGQRQGETKFIYIHVIF